jgi:ribonuclease P/MRP protein subunit POP5
MAKTKPLLPSLREKKRYLAYEVIGNHKFKDAVEVNKAIFDAAQEFLGSRGMAQAGVLEVDKWNSKLQRGLLRVNNRNVDELRASLNFVKTIANNDVIIKSVGASGILKKAQQRYLN